MRKRSIVIVVFVLAAIVAAALALRGEGAAAIERWFVELHGGGGGRR